MICRPEVEPSGMKGTIEKKLEEDVALIHAGREAHPVRSTTSQHRIRVRFDRLPAETYLFILGSR